MPPREPTSENRELIIQEKKKKVARYVSHLSSWVRSFEPIFQ